MRPQTRKHANTCVQSRSLKPVMRPRTTQGALRAVPFVIEDAAKAKQKTEFFHLYLLVSLLLFFQPSGHCLTDRSIDRLFLNRQSPSLKNSGTPSTQTGSQRSVLMFLYLFNVADSKEEAGSAGRPQRPEAHISKVPFCAGCARRRTSLFGERRASKFRFVVSLCRLQCWWDGNPWSVLSRRSLKVKIRGEGWGEIRQRVAAITTEVVASNRLRYN